MIIFWVTLHLDNKRKGPIFKGYRPNFRFHVQGLENDLVGLAEMKEAEVPFEPGETKLALFHMWGHPKVVGAITTGAKFTLQEGPNVVGSGVIEEIEYNEIDG